MWVPRGGHRWRAIEAMVAAALALASFPQLYIYSAADAVVRFASIESHIRVLTFPARSSSLVTGSPHGTFGRRASHRWSAGYSPSPLQQAVVCLGKQGAVSSDHNVPTGASADGTKQCCVPLPGSDSILHAMRTAQHAVHR